MKLSDGQIELLRETLGLEPVDESNPATLQLREHFGDHTFYVDQKGLHIWEPREQGGSVQALIGADRVAEWADEEKSVLAPHEPIDTDVVIDVSGVAPERRH